jgi:RNA polymerase sigma-70 factor (ECF subfamily)
MVLDEKLFEELFYKYYDRVYSGLIAKKCPPEVAQDLTQITFIKIWQYRSSFSFEIKPEIQIFRKARQVFIDWLRKEAHQRKLIDEMNKVSQSLKYSNIEITDTLKTAINQLPEKRKVVFSMAYIDGYSNKEIAEKLGISIKTVNAHIVQALKLLWKLLAFLIVMQIISS